MKFILLIVLSANGGTGMNMWKQPAITTAEFATQMACQDAINVFQKLVRESKLDYTGVTAACVSAGIEERK